MSRYNEQHATTMLNALQGTETLERFKQQVRADAINELKSKKDEIIKWLIKRDLEGYGTTNGELLDHILDIAEKLKENR